MGGQERRGRGMSLGPGAPRVGRGGGQERRKVYVLGWVWGARPGGDLRLNQGFRVQPV